MSYLKQEAADLFGSIWAPLSALVVTCLGVWLASQWLVGSRSVPAAIALILIIVVYLFDWMGHVLLPESPRLAVVFMELWVFAPLIVSASASAAIVVVSVKYAVPDSTPVPQKELINTTTAAITTFLSSSFIVWIGEKDDSRLAKRIQRAFFAKYKRQPTGVTPSDGIKYFAAESVGERLVYSNDYEGIEGWGRAARHQRAKRLAEELSK